MSGSEALFKCYDFDKDGVITKADVAHFLERLGIDTSPPDPALVTSLMEDIASSEGIQLPAFAAYMDRKLGTTDLKQVFELIDINRDGKIVKSDIELFVAAFGGSFAHTLCEQAGAKVDDIASEVMAASGATDDGATIDFASFQKAIEKAQTPPPISEQ